jgi:hypothetical protein
MSPIRAARPPQAPRQELVAEHVLPQPQQGPDLRQGAMPAEVEPVALELDRLRDPSDDVVGLEDRARPPAKPST